MKNISASYKNKKKSVLQDISFTLEMGQKLGIVGESGSGKSTLTRILAGFHPIERGEVLLQERPVRAKVKDRKWLNRKVQLVFQDSISSLDPQQTVRQVLEEPLCNFFSLTKKEREQQVGTILEEVNLKKDILNRKGRTLSGGQAQRVCIARSLLARPEILLCDEPVTGLDMMNQTRIINLLKKIVAEKQLAIIFVSHDISLVLDFCDVILVLKDGQQVDFFKAVEWNHTDRSDYTTKLIESINLQSLVFEMQRKVGDRLHPCS
ncbi:ABC transporter ATP-binding protein [Metabacillus herbersteinensis]|uniref:ABC transporter ATP-binding protein n=1 Tax=Metabacillus herbersteinensis TaxID=283816 RepID=UPI0036720EA7